MINQEHPMYPLLSIISINQQTQILPLYQQFLVTHKNPIPNQRSGKVTVHGCIYSKSSNDFRANASFCIYESIYFSAQKDRSFRKF
jgi:hypothetical protein